MRVYLTLLCLLFVPASYAAAADLVYPVDVPRHPTAQAVVTFDARGGGVTAMRFDQVPDLQSCFNLAWNAASKGHSESTATCLNARNKVVGSYYCAPAGDNQPFCRTIAP